MFGPSDNSDSEAGADPLVLVSVAVFNGVCDAHYNNHKKSFQRAFFFQTDDAITTSSSGIMLTSQTPFDLLIKQLVFSLILPYEIPFLSHFRRM